MQRFKVDDSKIDRSGPEYTKRIFYSKPAVDAEEVHVSFTLNTGRFQFFSDGSLAGENAVNAMAAVAEQDYQTLKGIYGLGDIPNQPIVVTVDVNAGGAYHIGCDGTAIHLIPEDAPSLLVAELDECFQALQGKMDCGLAVGEGHSRAMAHVVRPFKVLKGLDGDVRGWWNNGNPTDYFTNGTATDQNPQSNACNTLGWFWLNSLDISGHPITWPIATSKAAMTLGEVYMSLTGNTAQQGWNIFKDTLSKIPQPWADDPFTANPMPNPVPTPDPVLATNYTAVLIAGAIIVVGVILFLVLHH